MNSPVWLIGAGTMAREYAKVLMAQGRDFLIIGRGRDCARQCELETGCPVATGGLADFLGHTPAPRRAIVCTGVQDLAGTTLELLRAGTPRLLVEKPGGLDTAQIAAVDRAARAAGAGVYLAYNRRFFASTRQARRCIAEDGGVRSFCFEFTEWSHVVEALPHCPEVKARWFLANSSHVADLAFFLGGDPAEFHCRVAGGLPWHPSGSAFTGCGVSNSGALFSYLADWDAPGRWGVEVLTAKRRFFLKPMEKLMVQAKGGVAVEPVAIDDRLDLEFKPGLYRQVRAFLEDDLGDFRSIASQSGLAAAYDAMAGYAPLTTFP